MLLGEVMVLWLAGMLLIVGVVGFVFFILAALGRGIRAIWRALLPTDPDLGMRGGHHAGLARICDRSHCGYLNRADARYCARCGSPLDGGEG